METNTQRISRDEMIALVIDSKYSIDAQIAILRQKDEKPEDYEAFFAFAEEVKRKVTEEYEKYAEEDAKKSTKEADAE